ncbi:prevent-host-death family protein [Nocardiopsis arvandica]|uniref:Antitoxin n=1 Tax=Nocardiopsis sinuspersici TaxID=501010 RepID=A0A7Y9XCZ7_9ACTN|nr:type II toxin-antitoxin system prevent-host-death family antitoxin [Nocardiopsis sinuspersici]NYH52465.1 prevent-host-death family protein [Nocardiopsis sinuspersici]
MRTITATEAARKFSELLDAIESGERVTITRGGSPVTVMEPAPRYTGAGLRAALEKIEPLDDDFESDVLSVRAFVDDEVRNPWDDV